MTGESTAQEPRTEAERATAAAIKLAETGPYSLAQVVDTIRVFTFDESQRRVVEAAKAWTRTGAHILTPTAAGRALADAVSALAQEFPDGI